MIAVEASGHRPSLVSHELALDDSPIQVLRGLCGRVWAAFEEGTQAQWLYDVIAPLVERVVVCNPRETRQGENKSDRIDARKLADKLRLNALKPVFHNSANVRTLKELVRIYESLVSDGTRSKLRLKAIFRGRAIATPGESIYDAKKAVGQLAGITNSGAAFRARKLLEQIAKINELREETLTEMTREAKRHGAYKILDALPFIGAVRTAQLMAVMVTPFRFRTKRQLWTARSLLAWWPLSTRTRVVRSPAIQQRPALLDAHQCLHTESPLSWQPLPPLVARLVELRSYQEGAGFQCT